MGEDSKLGWKIKAQISRFAGRLSDGWAKTRRRLTGEMLYGIQAAKEVKVSEVARSLNEPIALIQTEKRLCRNLAAEDLTGPINRRLCFEGAPAVEPDSVLAVDLSDVTKPYARKMEHLATVRDGSTGELAGGYWLCEVIAAHPAGRRVVPLYGELYSQEAENFRSENEVILRAVGHVAEATDRRGIFTIDRGGDRRKLLIPLLDNKLRFIVRQSGERHIVLGSGRRCRVREAVRWCKALAERRVEVNREGYRKHLHITVGSLPVHLPERPEQALWLVVIRGFGSEPVMLLTDVAPKGSRREHAGWISDCYLTRWKCEEVYRCVKQSYHLEDVRVRSYVALRTLYALVHAAFYFISVVLGARSRLNLVFRKVCEKAKRFYEVADFFQYAVADGIHRLLFGSRTGPHRPAPGRPSGQTLLPFARPPS